MHPEWEWALKDFNFTHYSGINVDTGLCHVEIKNIDTVSELIIEVIVACEVIIKSLCFDIILLLKTDLLLIETFFRVSYEEGSAQDP